MPTKLRRYMVTETSQVAEALEDAAERWPQVRDSRSQLLLLLIEEGHRALHEEQEKKARRQREAIAQTSGILTGVYREDELERLREDWPE